MHEERRMMEKEQLESKYRRMGKDIERNFQRKKDDIEQQLGLVYQKLNKVDSGRTKDIELQPVETFVVDTET